MHTSVQVNVLLPNTFLWRSHSTTCKFTGWFPNTEQTNSKKCPNNPEEILFYFKRLFSVPGPSMRLDRLVKDGQVYFAKGRRFKQSFAAYSPARQKELVVKIKHPHPRVCTRCQVCSMFGLFHLQFDQ